MEQSFADLLSDVFSDTSVPSFPDGDLDFENVHFDEKFGENQTDASSESIPTKKDEALHQEATSQSVVLSDMQTKGMCAVENVAKDQSDKEDFEGVRVINMDKTPEEDYTSSDGDSAQEGFVSGEEDEEEDKRTREEPGELLMSVCSSGEVCDGDKEDGIFAEEQPLAPEGAEKPQVRNEEQGDSESDEEVSYFERVPECSSGMMAKGDGIEEDGHEREEEKREDSDSEGMKIEEEETILSACFEQEEEKPWRDGPTKASLEFPEISVQNLQDLIAEVDSEEYVEKMTEFSGEEHQDAGESFADYPSDFSSCEFVEDGGRNPKSNQQLGAKQDTCVERAVTDVAWVGRADGEGGEYLYSVDLEVDADKFRSQCEAGKKGISGDAAEMVCDDGGETGESYSSGGDEIENMHAQDLKNKKQEEQLCSGNSAARSTADFNINWDVDMLTSDTLLSEDLLTAEDKEETLSLHVTAESDNTSPTRTISPSNQGSLDDSFFFNTEQEAFGISELGQLGDDEFEEERNWEQEEERIKAFYEFYDDSDEENRREGRQIKVQFCTDPLSQVFHFESTSSDSDSFSSSTEGEEDLSSAETFEELKEPGNSPEMKPACDPQRGQLPENVPDLSNTQNCTRKHKCLNMLKATLKMGLVIAMGLLMFWLATDQADWLSQMSFF